MARATSLGPFLAAALVASRAAASEMPQSVVDPREPSVARSFDAVTAALDPFCRHACGASSLHASRLFLHNAAMVPLPSPRASSIVYDPALFDAMKPSSREAGTIGVLAHEYGHHLDVVMAVKLDTIAGFRSTFVAAEEEPWRRELRADAWAGCALGRLGKALEPVVAWMKDEQVDWVAGAAEKADDAMSHPPWNLRIAATSEGYFRCGGRGPEPAETLYQRALFAKPPPLAAPAPRPEEELLRRFGIVVPR